MKKESDNSDKVLNTGNSVSPLKNYDSDNVNETKKRSKSLNDSTLRKKKFKYSQSDDKLTN
jgi:hypothetical protein